MAILRQRPGDSWRGHAGKRCNNQVQGRGGAQASPALDGHGPLQGAGCTALRAEVVLACQGREGTSSDALVPKFWGASCHIRLWNVSWRM